METMTSMERVVTTLGHHELDRVPFFLLLTMHGARELNISIEEYFSKSENIVAAQLRLREKYQHHCYYPFSYGALEVEAFGGEVKYLSDGPSNAGFPIIKEERDIEQRKVPQLEDTSWLQRALKTIEQFCVQWANALLSGGATALCYFDPMLSPSMIPTSMYRQSCTYPLSSPEDIGTL